MDMVGLLNRSGHGGVTMLELNLANLHHAVLRHLADRGFAPSVASLARDFEVDTDVMASALRQLQDGHGVVLHPHVPEID